MSFNKVFHQTAHNIKRHIRPSADSAANMRSRTELLTEFVEQAKPTSSTIEELRAYGWDSQANLVTLTKAHVLHVLAAFERGSIVASQVRDWANRLECRDDLDFEGGGEGVVNEALFWLANPAINWPIDESLCRRIELLFASDSVE